MFGLSGSHMNIRRSMAQVDVQLPVDAGVRIGAVGNDTPSTERDPQPRRLGQEQLICVSGVEVMGENVIVCCDGTGNEFGDHNLNVVKLNSVLTQPDSPEVGILASGKMGTPRARNKISKPGQSGRYWLLALDSSFDRRERAVSDPAEPLKGLLLPFYTRLSRAIRVATVSRRLR